MAKMKDDSALQQLKAAIKARQPGRLYIFHGEEAFLLRHYLLQMHKLIVDELTESFNYTRLNNENFQLQTFVDAVESFPMMAQRTLVQVDEIDLFKLPEGERTKIAEVLNDIPDHCTVIFTYETVAWKPDKRQKKLWEAIESQGLTVEFAKQELRDLIAWVTRHFSARGKRITPELCGYLIDITGGTMTALSGEIGKIAAYSGAENICKADIDAVTEPVLDAVVFQMTDLLSQGQYGPALSKLQQLLKMQQEPLAILGYIGAHFRKLAAARILRDAGKQATELVGLYHMSDFAARKTMSAAGDFSNRFYARAAQLVLETDRQIKTSQDAPERLLEVLIMELAQEARND